MIIDKQYLIGFEDKVKALFESGKLNCPVHLSGGNEDALLEIFSNISNNDYVLSTHRNHYHYLLHTGDTDGLLNEIIGNYNGICKGNARSMHIINHARRFYSSAIVAGLVSTAVGIALGIQIREDKDNVWCFIGDGACDEGWFWEAIRYASGHNLPIRFIIEDNDRSVATNKYERWGLWDDLREQLEPYITHIVYYNYIPKYPHVGSGKWITMDGK